MVKLEKNGYETEKKSDESENDDYLTYEVYKELMEKYFEQHSSFFLNGRYDARVAFLVGVLSAHLISTQEKIFNSDAPIWRSFGNLDFDERKIKWLFVKVRTKLQQYSKKSNPPQKLIHLIADTWTKAGEFSLDRIELSWFFCIGLACRSEVSQRVLKESFS